MELNDGHLLPNLFQTEWVSNADKDGIIILILTSIKINGVFINNGIYI